MKKVLFASTALVAFSLAGAAQAADPISLKLGGYAKWAFGFTGTDNVQSPAVLGDAEVHFKGSTTLDNGIQIGVRVEMEAQNDGGDTGGGGIDESVVTITGGFGQLMIGTEDNGAYLLHVTAPDAASMNEDATLALKNAWTQVGSTGFNTSNQTTAISTGDDPLLTYVAPSFAGFTVGASYVPHLNTEAVQTNGVQTDADLSDVIGFAAAYNNTFSGVGIKASVGYATILDLDDSPDFFSFGAQIGYAGVTVGGAYKLESNDGDDNDNSIWTVGGMYATGPFAVSLNYWRSNAADAFGDDDVEDIHVSGKYNMGPGVDAIASIGYVDEENDGNDGEFAGMVGLALSF